MTEGNEIKTEEQDKRELTFGEKAVGLTFNPGGNPNVDIIKRLYAEIIDELNEIRGEDRSDKARLLSVAITEARGSIPLLSIRYYRSTLDIHFRYTIIKSVQS